jgi:methionine-rich copper-binding protein CopC
LKGDLSQMTSGPGLAAGAHAFAAVDGPVSNAGRGGAPAGRVRLFVTALAIVVVAAAALASSASASLTAAGPTDPDTRFPAWYSDTTGLALQLCLDGLPSCLAARSDLIDPALAGDGEAFYYAADADVGPMTVSNHLESAYAAPGADQEVVFMRSDIDQPKAGLLPANSTYKVTDPWGTLADCKTDANGVITRNACRTETTPVPLSFTPPLAGRIGPFVTWDSTPPNTAPPAGFIGDNVTPHKVTGAPTGFNKVRVQGPGINDSATDACPDVAGAIADCAETDLFIVQGKVEPVGVSARTSASSLDYGNQTAGSSVTKTITYTSTGSSGNAVVSGVTLGGANAADFKVAENCTTAGTVAAPGLAPGASCSIGVTFTSRAGATSAATVTIADNTAVSPRTIKLSGSSTAVVNLDPTSIAFPSTTVNTPAETNVVVSNTGAAPVSITSATIGGTLPGNYSVSNNTCAAALAPNGAGCEIGVTFRPTSTGSKPATLVVKDDAGKTYNVPLTGTGLAAPPQSDLTAPTLTARSPGATATGVAATANVTATFSEAVQNVTDATFTLTDPTGAVVPALVTRNGTTNQWILNPDVNLASGTQYKVTLTNGIKDLATPTPNAFAGTTWTFTTAAAATDTVAPTVSSRTPAVGGTAVAGTSTVTATFSENVSGVTGTTFTLKNAAGTAVTATMAYNATTHVATLTPSAALANDTKYTAALTAGIKDTAGNALAATSWSFTTGPRPTVTARTPASGATAMANTSTVTATFSENVTGVSGTTVTLKNAAGTAVTATVAYNATTHVATLTPSAALANDTKYTAALTTAIKDAAGNPIAATSWSFTTGPRPTVTGRTPAANATAVSRTANVTATFSEAVTGTSTTTVTLKPVSATGTLGTAVTAVVSYNATTRVATLDPSATLAANTKYTAALTTGIKDTAGNPIAATSWSFTTGP